MHIRVWRYPLEVASSLEVRSLQYLRSPFKKRDEILDLTPVQTCTVSLRLARINVSEPSSSVMDIDASKKAFR